MFTLNCKGRILLVDKPLVMGILNITPDSFYSGSRTETLADVVRKAEQMLTDGAAILDLGGQSTRPGSERVSADEEAARVIPAIEAVRSRFPDCFISADTFYGSVAVAAVAAGADIVNDISAGSLDPELLPAVARLGVPYVLMHMKGSPQDMQEKAGYTDVALEVYDYLAEKKKLLQDAGIQDIILDPGFGFAKNSGHNFKLLQQLRLLSALDAPLLLGISRKSFIWKTLRTEAGSEATLQGTIALHMAGLLSGASILRVHDVAPAVQTIRLYRELQMA